MSYCIKHSCNNCYECPAEWMKRRAEATEGGAVKVFVMLALSLISLVVFLALRFIGLIP